MNTSFLSRVKYSKLLHLLLPWSCLVTSHFAAQAAELANDYVLGIGDVLSVENTDGSVSKVPVLPDGRAVIPDVGSVNVFGQTIGKVLATVTASRKESNHNSIIGITLDRRGEAQVYLLGAVEHPGLYTAPVEKDLVSNTKKEVFTIPTLLALAGGLKANADWQHLQVTRVSKNLVIDVNLWRLLFDGDVTEDLVLQPGDVVYIPAVVADTTNGATIDESGMLAPSGSRTRIMGAVRSPGLIFIPRSGKDLVEAIAVAGGLTDDATNTIVVARSDSSGRVVSQIVNFHEATVGARYRLKPGDIVVVKTKNGSRQNPSSIQSLNNFGLPPNTPIGDFGPMLYRLAPATQAGSQTP